LDEQFFDLHFNANVKGLFFTVQKGLPLLRDGGSIVLNASIADIKGFPAMSVYRSAHVDHDQWRHPVDQQLEPERPAIDAHVGPPKGSKSRERVNS
jgi:NADP-dependent 3-hydroxy acid dehydrogenase YdfG